MADAETISIYDAQAERYAELVSSDKPEPILVRFIELFERGSRILDFGCGPGDHAAAMVAAGLVVDAVDGSAEMVALANERYAVGARQATFDGLDAVDVYDGVWANFSLLHAPRDEFPGHISRIARALCSGGFLHLGLKTGSGEGRDKLGRHYTYYTSVELRAILADAGFKLVSESHGESAGLSGEVAPWLVQTVQLT